MKRKVKMSILIKQPYCKLFNQNGHFYFSFQICITCTYLTNIFGYIYIYIYIYIFIITSSPASRFRLPSAAAAAFFTAQVAAAPT